MPEITKIVMRNAREQDIPAVVEIDKEAFAIYDSAETPETFLSRMTTFPDGFIILVADNEIAAYASSEKWLTEREPSLDVNPLGNHHPDGRILGVTAVAVKAKYRGKGYGLRILDKLVEVAHHNRCQKVIVQTSRAQGFFLKRGFQKVQTRIDRGVSVDVMSLDS